VRGVHDYGGRTERKKKFNIPGLTQRKRKTIPGGSQRGGRASPSGSLQERKGEFEKTGCDPTRRGFGIRSPTSEGGGGERGASQRKKKRKGTSDIKGPKPSETEEKAPQALRGFRRVLQKKKNEKNIRGAAQKNSKRVAAWDVNSATFTISGGPRGGRSLVH